MPRRTRRTVPNPYVGSGMTHEGLEFYVGQAGGGYDDVFRTYDKAAEHAVAMSVARRQDWCIDVFAHTRVAAEAWGGGLSYDPVAFVHERIVVRARSQGHIFG